MADFFSSCAQLRDAALRLDTIAAGSGAAGSGALAIAEHLAAEPFRVLVIGEFSRGKSTFINALVGEKLLPSSVRPTTAVITVLRNGPERSAVIHWRDASRLPEHVDIPVGAGTKQLDAVVTAKNATGAEIAKVEITVPMPHLRLPFELVDTPGVNDIDTQREEITYGFLARADAAIVMLDLQQPLSASEKRFLTEKVLSNDLRKLLFVINKIDQEPPEKLGRALAYVAQRLSEVEACKGAPILPVAAKLALQGKQAGDSAALGASRFPEFEKRLQGFLLEASGKSRVATATRRMSRLVLQQRQSVEALVAGLATESQQAAAAVSAAHDELRGELAVFQATRSALDVAVEGFVASTTTRVRGRLASLRKDIGEVTRRESFPSEADVDACRGLLNLGLRDVVAIPSAEGARVAGEAVVRYGGRAAGGEWAPELAAVQDFDLRLQVDSQKSEQYSRVGGVVGGLVGAALFGPFGAVVTGALGGAIAAAIGERPDPSRITAEMNRYLDDIDSHARAAVQESANGLRRFLQEEISAPQEAAIADRQGVVEKLRAAASQTIAERQQLADRARSRVAELDGLMHHLERIAEAA